jgi:hypothetical protein
VISIGLEARKGRIPWRFETFMDWAYGAGLLRLTGVSYQFRHDKLKASLESNEAELGAFSSRIWPLDRALMLRVTRPLGGDC